jgi:hypothetical protein
MKKTQTLRFVLSGFGVLAARKAWIAVTGYIDQHDDTTNVCEGTNKLNSLDYYLARRRKTGDFHGQAPILWAASALLRWQKFNTRLRRTLRLRWEAPCT